MSPASTLAYWNLLPWISYVSWMKQFCQTERHKFCMGLTTDATAPRGGTWQSFVVLSQFSLTPNEPCPLIMLCSLDGAPNKSYCAWQWTVTCGPVQDGSKWYMCPRHDTWHSHKHKNKHGKLHFATLTFLPECEKECLFKMSLKAGSLSTLSKGPISSFRIQTSHHKVLQEFD